MGTRLPIVIHDYFERPEGGGRLSLILARELKADICHGFKNPGHPFFQEWDGREYDLKCFPNIPLLRQFLLIRAFERKTNFLENNDPVIFSGSYAPLAVRNAGGRKIYYCHTPPRFIYDKRDFFLSSLPAWQRPILTGFTRYLKPRYESALKQMKMIVTCSKNVRKRILNYLGIDSVVIHPPCETKKYHYLGQEDFYLSIARLDPLKRVDRVVSAFLRMPWKNLVVVSGGPDATKIKKLVQNAANIRILGVVSERKLRELLGRCRCAPTRRLSAGNGLDGDDAVLDAVKRRSADIRNGLLHPGLVRRDFDGRNVGYRSHTCR